MEEDVETKATTTSKDNHDESTNDWSVFKRCLLRHRRQAKAPHRLDDLYDLVDFGNPSDNQEILPLTVPTTNEDPSYTGPLFGLRGFPGFVYAPAALSQELQDHIAFQAVSTYCERPHRTNIDLVPPKSSEVNNPHEHMWDIYKSDHGFSMVDPSSTPQRAPPVPKNKEPRKNRYKSFRKLSWATMGYHYDWTARVYDKDAKSHMPLEMQRLGMLFARTALLLQQQQPLEKESSISLNFEASASIVNYYNEKSVMGGHRDDLELALDKPIISLSMGRSAVFLLGGATKDSNVRPILVRPGDVMMMGGPSRLCYHAMARLLPAHGIPAAAIAQLTRPLKVSDVTDLSPPDETNPAIDPLSSEDQEALAHFLAEHRLNINLRQVYPDEE